jgi:hypothetical protein
MMRQPTKRPSDSMSAGVLDHLTDAQHLHPHRPLRETLANNAAKLGIDSTDIDRTLTRLSLDGAGAIGRLRRTELTQLARHIERRRDADEGSSPSPNPLQSVERCGRS